MNAKKCDRCGAFYTEKECKTAVGEIFSGLIKAIQSIGLTEGQRDILDETEFNFDLCPECSESFRAWLRAKNRGCDDAQEQEAEYVEC